MRSGYWLGLLSAFACSPWVTDSDAEHAEPSRVERGSLSSDVTPGWQAEEPRCFLTELDKPRSRTGWGASCDAISRDGRISAILMPRNTCAIEVEGSQVAQLSSCRAYSADDGTRILEMRWGGMNPTLDHSYFGREYVARIVTPPPPGQSQRFDVRLSCAGESQTFDFEKGHSPHLAEVRFDTLSAGALADLGAKTGNDSRSVGTLTIHKWSAEEVIGSVVGVDIRPSKLAIRVRMWFRLDWQSKASSYQWRDCDPYRKAREEFEEQWRRRLEQQAQ